MKEPNRSSSAYGLAILAGLQNRHMYAGTVPVADVERRRAKNKAARRARKANRRGGSR